MIAGRQGCRWLLNGKGACWIIASIYIHGKYDLMIEYSFLAGCRLEGWRADGWLDVRWQAVRLDGLAGAWQAGRLAGLLHMNGLEGFAGWQASLLAAGGCRWLTYSNKWAMKGYMYP